VLRVGVIGLGVGEQHAEAWQRHSDCEVVALCDLNAELLEVVGSRYPEARRFERDTDLLDADIDAVSIASYDSHHFEHVRTALERGLHVFVEKPLCTSEDEAAVLRALRRGNPGLRLSSNLPLRRSPRFLDLRERIQRGELGRLYYAELDYEYGRLWKLTEGWRGREPEYSVMLGGGVHLIDLVVTLLQLDDGMVAKVAANFGCVRPHFHAVKVFGTEGTFLNGADEATIWTGDRRAPQATRLDSAYPGVHKGELIHSFAEAILRGTTPDVTEQEVFRTMDVLFAIERARQTGVPTSLHGR
jgi:predicted dehydrogenase